MPYVSGFQTLQISFYLTTIVRSSGSIVHRQPIQTINRSAPNQTKQHQALSAHAITLNDPLATKVKA